MSHADADFIFTAGSIIFIFALIPTVIGDDLPPKITSFITSTILYLFSITYWQIDLYFSAVSSLILATLWNIVFIRKIEKG